MKIRMANKHMKKCSTAFVIMKMQIKTTMRYHLTLARLLLFSHSVMSDSATSWTAARQASLPFTISQNLLKPMSIESVTPSNHLILAVPFPPALNPSRHQSFFPVSQLFEPSGPSIRASASASVLPMNIQD